MTLIWLLSLDPIHTIHKSHQWRRGAGGLVEGHAMDREDGGWTPAGREGGEEMLAQKEGNGHIFVIVGLSQITEREKPKVTPGTNPVPEF